MANTFLTNDIIAKEMIVALYDEVVLSLLVNTSYASEFNDGVARGTEVRVLLPLYLEAYDWNGASTFTVQNLRNTATKVTVDKVFDCSIAITSLEWKFNVTNFSERYAVPAIKALVQRVEKYLITQMYAGTQRVITGLNGYPTDAADLALINKAAREMKIKSGEAISVIGLEAEAIMLGNIKNLIEADKRADAGVNFANATVGRAMGVQYYHSDALDEVHDGIDSTYTGTATVTANVNAVDGQIVEVKLTGGVAGETIHEGQLLKAGDVIFAVAKTATFTSSGNVTFEVSNLQDNLVAGTIVSKYEDVKGSFLFHRDAVALIVLTLPLPMAGEYKTIVTDSQTGFSVRMTAGYDLPSKADTMSFDLVCGAKVLDPRRIAIY